MGMKDTKTSKLKEMTARLKQPQPYKPLGIMIAFFAFQQFSGIFVIFVYAAQFSVQAGVTIDPLLSAVFIVSSLIILKLPFLMHIFLTAKKGLTRVITTVLMAFISDKYGRKPPARFSGIGMCFSMLGNISLYIFKHLR